MQTPWAVLLHPILNGESCYRLCYVDTVLLLTEDTLVPTTLPGARSGTRGKLPARDLPGEPSTSIAGATFGDKLYIGGSSVYPLSHADVTHGKVGDWNLGDEFPTVSGGSVPKGWGMPGCDGMCE
jgi:hypothetical protein